MANPKILVEIGAKINQFLTDLNDAESALQKFATKSIAIGAGLTAAVTLPIIALGNATLKAASDAEETAAKFGVVFRDIQGSAEESFKILRNEYGLSSTAAKQLLADTGDLLTGFGFSQTAALDLSTQVAKLGADLASFTNFAGGAEGATQALTKALLGERDSVKALGITILEEDVKKQVAINTAKGLTFETERQAKAYATLDLALEQSKNAIGDFSRTSEGFANQQRIANGRIQELSESLGTIFLPLATKIVGVVVKIAESLNSLSDTTKTVIVVIAGLAAAVGPVLLVIGTFIKVLPVLITGLGTLKTAIIAATGPFGLIAIAVAAAIPLLFELNTELNRTKNIKADVAQQLLTDRIDQTNLALEDQLTRIKEIYPELNEEAKIRKVLKNELDKLNKEGNKNSASYKAQRAAILDWGLAAIESAKNAGKLGEGVKLTREEFDKLADSGNEKFFRESAESADAFNAILSETARLAKSIQEGSEGIASGIGKPLIQNIGINIGDGPPVIEIPEIDESKKTAFLLSLQDFNDQASAILEGGIENTIGDFAFAIGDALASGGNVLKAAGGALLGGIAAILNQLGQLAIATGVAIGGIKKALLTLNPAVAIGAGVALVALAGFVSNKAKSLGGGVGSGGSGGGSVGAGVSGQTFGGSGFSSNPINIGGEFVIKGPNLVYTINQTLNKNAKG
jgi:hypothetical protein